MYVNVCKCNSHASMCITTTSDTVPYSTDDDVLMYIVNCIGYMREVQTEKIYGLTCAYRDCSSA